MKKIVYLVLIFSVSQLFALETRSLRIPRGESQYKPTEKVIPHTKISFDTNSSVVKKKTTRIFNKKEKKVFANRPKSRIQSLSTRNSGDWVAYMFDDFEGVFPGYWILEGSPTWGGTDYRAASGTYSAWCAGSDYTPIHGYVNNMNAWMIDGPFDMTAAKNAELYFDYWVDTEADYDSLFVGVSTDGETFFGNIYSGDSEGWVFDELINLVEYAGVENLYVGVNFLSDDINSGYEGAYVDNVELDAYESDGKEKRIDLKVYALKVSEPESDGKFKFRLKNLGPAKCEAEDYLIKVYVDGLEDSFAYNQKSLNPGDVAIWDWQLAYIYPPGLHLVEVEVFPFYIEKKPENNYLFFNMLSKGINLTALSVPTATGAVNNAFSLILAATNGAPPYSWAYYSGQLPSGLYVSGEGIILGAPQNTGSYTFAVAVMDAGDFTAYKEITLEIIEPSGLIAPQIFNKVLPVAFVNSFYEVTLKGVGGVEPYTWSSPGGIPDGLALTAASGDLSGTPTFPDQFLFPVNLEGDDGENSTADLTLKVKEESDSLTGNIDKALIKNKGGSKDSIKIKAAFDIPEEFVLDKYTRLVIYLGDYPVSFGKPNNAKWRAKATFKSEKGVLPKTKATLKWPSKNQLRLSFTLKKAELSKILSGYVLSGDVIVPIRIVINEKDTGIIQQKFIVK